MIAQSTIFQADFKNISVKVSTRFRQKSMLQFKYMDAHAAAHVYTSSNANEMSESP